MGARLGGWALTFASLALFVVLLCLCFLLFINVSFPQVFAVLIFDNVVSTNAYQFKPPVCRLQCLVRLDRVCLLGMRVCVCVCSLFLPLRKVHRHGGQRGVHHGPELHRGWRNGHRRMMEVVN